MISFPFFTKKIILKQLFFLLNAQWFMMYHLQRVHQRQEIQGATALWSVYDVCHDMFGSLKMISFIIEAELKQED